jgi:hypothetical protein
MRNHSPVCTRCSQPVRGRTGLRSSAMLPNRKVVRLVYCPSCQEGMTSGPTVSSLHARQQLWPWVRKEGI